MTLTANRSILACNEDDLLATSSASENKLPNISSACRLNELSWRMMLAKEPFVTPSNSSGTGYCNVPRLRFTGSISLSGRGIFCTFLLFLSLRLNYEFGVFSIGHFRPNLRVSCSYQGTVNVVNSFSSSSVRSNGGIGIAAGLLHRLH